MRKFKDGESIAIGFMLIFISAFFWWLVGALFV